MKGEATVISESGTRLEFLSFESQLSPHCTISFSDAGIADNQQFTYPVIIPVQSKKPKKAIIYLHGLNERSWTKHLCGAQYLAETTGRIVILFPLSFHINRGLPGWSNPQEVRATLEKRVQSNPGILNASVANIALSQRLAELPERFMISGYQSACDIVSLVQSIELGNHSLFEKGTKVDFFAYSISCLVMQTLMITNPAGILDSSKIIFFAGGSFFCNMNGSSRFIMDNLAFDRIYKYYLDEVEVVPPKQKNLYAFIKENPLSNAFISLIAPERMRRFRENLLERYHPNQMVMALRDDLVIPLGGIMAVLGERFTHGKNFRVLHFDYAYSHENPLPAMNKKIEHLVEQAFYAIYQPATEFLLR